MKQTQIHHNRAKKKTHRATDQTNVKIHPKHVITARYTRVNRSSAFISVKGNILFCVIKREWVQLISLSLQTCSLAAAADCEYMNEINNFQIKHILTGWNDCAFRHTHLSFSNHITPAHTVCVGESCPLISSYTFKIFVRMLTYCLICLCIS